MPFQDHFNSAVSITTSNRKQAQCVCVLAFSLLGALGKALHGVGLADCLFLGKLS